MTHVGDQLRPLRSLRILRILERNARVLRGTVLFWMLLLSGIAEPLCYLLSIGLGVGGLVGTRIDYAGHQLSYAAFVAPGALAASAVSGAVGSATFGFFAKLRLSGHFESLAATPVTAFEIVLSELLWAMLLGLGFSALFLVAMATLGLTSVAGVLGALPATALVGLAFGAIGMAVSTVIRGWQDFDIVLVTQTALLLFSGVFFSVDRYPHWLRTLIALTPLYHAVELVRSLAVCAYRPAVLIPVAYLSAMVVAGLVFSYRQMERVLRQ